MASTPPLFRGVGKGGGDRGSVTIHISSFFKMSNLDGFGFIPGVLELQATLGKNTQFCVILPISLLQLASNND